MVLMHEEKLKSLIGDKRKMQRPHTHRSPQKAHTISEVFAVA